MQGITLTAITGPPEIEGLIDIYVLEGSSSSLGFDITDLDGTDISVEILDAPDYVTLFYNTGDETGIIAIDTVSGGGATENSTPQAVTLTISENESAPTVTLTSNVTTIGEKSGSSITFTATASGAADENIIVSLSQSGTATEGTDYAEMSNITINALSTTGTSSFLLIEISG